MTTRRSSGPPSPSPVASATPTPEQRFAEHVRGGVRGLVWHYELGLLVRRCCPTRRGRSRKMTELATGSPPCSPSLLYKVMKFGVEHTRREAVQLERDGVGWDTLAVFICLPKRERLAAVREVVRHRLSSREIRKWKADQYGTATPRGGRPPRPLPAHSPDVQARALAGDCRRLHAAHMNTAGVFETVLRDLGDGVVPAQEVLAELRAADEAVGSLQVGLNRIRGFLVRIVAACGESRP